jgi:hypothetical protein
MVSYISLISGCLFAASLPHWIPRLVVGLRMRIFTRINGAEGIAIPGELADVSRFRQLYSHPAADGRSRGAALSDLFWYWLSPGPEMHQEHLEPGAKYEEVARATRRILACSRGEAEELTASCATRVLDELQIGRPKLVRLRDLMMPIWAEFYYELVFGERCPPGARALIVANANDVVTSLKCCGLRHMRKRDRLTEYLREKIAAGAVSRQLPESLSMQERALYVQGVFFNTAIVQMSEAMAHLLMVLAQNQEVQRLAREPKSEAFLDRVLAETMRLYPLFGIAHRITSAEIVIDQDVTLPKGSVLCFNYPEYHRAGFDSPDRFDPNRWQTYSVRDANYIPFGVAANRPCPASGLAPVTMHTAVREVLQRFTLYSSASHTRSIPNRGPCFLVPRSSGAEPPISAGRLALLRLRDRWEDVWRSLVQLVLGTYMVWDARRLRLCGEYFEAQDGKVQAAHAATVPPCARRSSPATVRRKE